MNHFKHLFFTAVLLSCFACNRTEPQKEYDNRTSQVPVTSKAGIDSVLGLYEQVSYSELDSAYISYAGLNRKKHIYRKKKFYRVRGPEMFRYLVGTFRVEDFLPSDDYYYKSYIDPYGGHEQYLLIDKRLLYKFLELLEELQKRGLDTVR